MDTIERVADWLVAVDDDLTATVDAETEREVFRAALMEILPILDPGGFLSVRLGVRWAHREHVLSKDCWCNPTVTEIPPKEAVDA